MFLEDEDWNDDKAQVLTPAEPQPDLTTPNLKTKVVGKRSLLRTLQTLGSVPDWSSEGPHRGSDSEGDAAEHTKKKRKKKRRKRRRGESDEQQEEEKEEEEEGVKEKKRKKDSDGKKVTSASTEKPQDSAKPGDSEAKLSRKQWRNHMKNKKKSKNKFKPHEASEERDGKQNNGEISSSTDCQAHQVKKKGKAQKIKGSTQTQSERVEIIKKNNTDKEVHKEVNFELNRQAKLKKEKLRRLLQSKETKEEESGAVEGRVEEVAPEAEGPTVDPPDPSASLRSRMEQRLDSARFRFINEVLYSSSSRDAQRMFKQDQEAFWVYHRGYSSQVQRWPQNPVDLIIHFIKTKPASLVVADFGCGDCKIAKSVKNRVHSFDLVSTCDLVTACDMAHVPLKDNSVDIAVFCLSLMGTNLADFLREANRVLKKGGFLKVAEVSSRFEDVRSFTSALSTLGFKLLSKDTENSHFYSFDFMKTGPAPENLKKFGLQLKPCVYKKR